MTRAAKLPTTPPADLAGRQPDWYRWAPARPLWTIADGAGPYARPFGQMRSWGPLETARFDPHPEPPHDTSGELVLYAASDLVTAVAERYQHRRALELGDHRQPVVYSWSPLRRLRLLDLSGSGAVRLGASHVINSGPKPVSRRWAQAFRTAWPDADGLRYTSSMAGHDCAVLWAPAADTFPSAPALALPVSLRATAWQALLEGVCATLGFDYLP